MRRRLPVQQDKFGAVSVMFAFRYVRVNREQSPLASDGSLEPLTNSNTVALVI